MVDLQVDVTKKGIWKYWRHLPAVNEKFWLSLDEGNTPEVTIDGIIFKREDLNPTGSLKDRGLAYQVSQAYSEGHKNLVISSSGNAAISAAAYCQLAKINLFAFVPKNINLEKLEKIKELDGLIMISDRPVSDSIKFAKEKGFKNLRPSVDPLGTEGYKTITFEIFKEFGKIDDIFLPVSSATCLVGIAKGFRVLGFLPRIHACQSTKIFNIAGEFDKDFRKTKTSLATALVAKITPKKEEAIKIIRESGGWGWVVGDGKERDKRNKRDKGIKEAMEWLEERGLETSAEGALGLAAIWKAKSKGWKLGKTVCLLTGRKYEKR